MKKILIVFFIFFYPHLSFAESNDKYYEKYFYIGKIKSHHDKFTLFFKTREKAIIAKGKNSKYSSKLAVNRCLRAIKEKKVKNTSGTDTDVGCDIICVHSDTPNAVEIIKNLKKALKK